MKIGLVGVPLRFNWRLSTLYVPFSNWRTSPGLRLLKAVWIVVLEAPAVMVLFGGPAGGGSARVVKVAVLTSVVVPLVTVTSTS
jgi:hypothetical protein